MVESILRRKENSVTINGFASDNRAGVHPRMMKALEAVNEGHAASYEEDEASRRAKDVLRDVARR